MSKEELPVEETDLERAEQIENLLITEGVMIPGKDLVHYMTRNASYMRLINSQAFKDSAIDLEEILDDTFIEEQFKQNAETARIMRFVTEKVVEKMNVVEPTLEQDQMTEAVETVKEMLDD